MSIDCFLGINLFYTFFDGAFITLVHEFNNVMNLGFRSIFRKLTATLLTTSFMHIVIFIICKKGVYVFVIQVDRSGWVGKNISILIGPHT